MERRKHLPVILSALSIVVLAFAEFIFFIVDHNGGYGTDPAGLAAQHILYFVPFVISAIAVLLIQWTKANARVIVCFVLAFDLLFWIADYTVLNRAMHGSALASFSKGYTLTGLIVSAAALVLVILLEGRLSLHIASGVHLAVLLFALAFQFAKLTQAGVESHRELYDLLVCISWIIYYASFMYMGMFLNKFNKTEFLDFAYMIYPDHRGDDFEDDYVYSLQSAAVKMTGSALENTDEELVSAISLMSAAAENLCSLRLNDIPSDAEMRGALKVFSDRMKKIAEKEEDNYIASHIYDTLLCASEAEREFREFALYVAVRMFKPTRSAQFFDAAKDLSYYVKLNHKDHNGENEGEDVRI